MNYINFKRIVIKGFLSVGKEPVVVEFTEGLHVITGVNKDKADRRNGVGKSTIADAVHFAVFGETIRDIKREHIANHKHFRSCEVTMDLEIRGEQKKTNITITRKLSPSKCTVEVNGEDKTRDSISNTNGYIHDLLACSPEIFQNCVIMTVNNTTPFMAKRKGDKRKFIEGIFNLQVFSEMVLNLKQDFNLEKQNFEVEKVRLDEVKKSLLAYSDQKKTHITEKKKREEKLHSRRKNNNQEIKVLNTYLNDQEENLVDDDDARSQISEYEDKIRGCDNKISDHSTIKVKNETNLKHKHTEQLNVGTDHDTCPTCLKVLDDTDRGRINQRKDSIQTEIDDLKKGLEIAKNKVEEYSHLKELLRQSINNHNEHIIKTAKDDSKKSRLSQLIEWNDEIDESLKNNKSKSTQFDSLIEESTLKITTLRKEISSISNKIELLETVKFIVSEEGVKSYIVKKLLNLFNGKLAYYLQKMDSNCQCTFNEYFEEEIINEKGKLCSYFNFSGAERKNIDLACLFAFMDIRRMQGDVAYNLSIYDELLDSSLDERGVELVLDILKERVKKYNECVMIISHRKESIKAATGEIIFLEKENGITRRVDSADRNST